MNITELLVNIVVMTKVEEHIASFHTLVLMNRINRQAKMLDCIQKAIKHEINVTAR